MFYCELIEIFKDIYFTVHRRTTASEIQPTQDSDFSKGGKSNMRRWDLVLKARLYDPVILFLSLFKIPKSHLVFWCGNFVESHRFRTVSGKSPETMRKLYLSTKFSLQEIR